MFYTQFLFQKKGALAHVWIAAHWERRLKKPQIMTVDIVKAAGQISNPAVAMALRLSGQLLLGLVRIYQKKVDFLHSDVVDARLKLQQMGRASQKKKQIDDPGVVANPGQITIDEGEGPIDELEWKTVDEVLENMSIDGDLIDLSMATTPAKPRHHALHTAPAAQLTLQGQEHVQLDPATDHHQPGVTIADYEALDLFAGLADDPDPMRDQQAGGGADSASGKEKKGDAMDETKDGDEVARGVEQKQDDQNPLLGGDIPVDVPEDLPVNASGVGDIKLEPPSQPGDAMNTDPDKPAGSQQQQSQKDKKDGKGENKKKDKGKQQSQQEDLDDSFRPKGRKRKLLADHDEKTELSSHEIKENLQDTTSIVGRRDIVPLSKRQKLQHDEKEPESNLEDMFFQPAFGLGLASGANFGAVMSPLRDGAVPGLLAPGLRATFDRMMRDDDGKGDALPVDPAIASSQQRLADIGEQLGVDPNNLMMLDDPNADPAAAAMDGKGDDPNMMQDQLADPIDQPPIDGSVPEAPFAGSKSPAKAPAEAGSSFLGGDIDKDAQILASMAEKDAAALKEARDYFNEKEEDEEETKEGSQAPAAAAEGSASKRLGFGWSKRTDKMVAVLNKDFRELEKKEKKDKRKSGAGSADSAATATLNLNDMLNGRGRRVAAGVFYQMLVLKVLDYVNVQQDAYTEDNPFPPILITRSEAFEVSRSQSQSVH